jgi:hypothetical protein
MRAAASLWCTACRREGHTVTAHEKPSEAAQLARVAEQRGDLTQAALWRAVAMTLHARRRRLS